MCHLVALRAAVLRCPRTYSGRDLCPRTVGAHRRRFHGRPRTGPAGSVSRLDVRTEPDVHPPVSADPCGWPGEGTRERHRCPAEWAGGPRERDACQAEWAQGRPCACGRVLGWASARPRSRGMWPADFSSLRASRRDGGAASGRDLTRKVARLPRHAAGGCTWRVPAVDLAATERDLRACVCPPRPPGAATGGHCVSPKWVGTTEREWPPVSPEAESGSALLLFSPAATCWLSQKERRLTVCPYGANRRVQPSPLRTGDQQPKFQPTTWAGLGHLSDDLGHYDSGREVGEATGGAAHGRTGRTAGGHPGPD